MKRFIPILILSALMLANLSGCSDSNEPDLIASELHVRNADRAEVDTLAVHEPFTVSLFRRDWLLPTGQSVSLEFLIDGEVAAVGSDRTNAVIDPANLLAETREDNNSLSATVVVR